MKRVLTVLSAVSILLMASSLVAAAGGSATVGIGYTYLDEVGNESINYRSFNDYEGVGLSLERFRYQLTNGIRFHADLKNISLNNRDLRLGVTKPGLFGIEFAHNQYRRVYDFDGARFTRRATTSGSAWCRPHKYVKLYAGVTGVSKSGQSVELFSIAPTVVGGGDPVVRQDYTQMYYHGGGQFNYGGRSLQVEYRTNKYDDDLHADRTQKRSTVTLSALLPVPRFERLVLHGGYRHFSTRYDHSDFDISSNTCWGGATYADKSGVFARYSFFFDRAGSDSDLVNTDNIANAVYIGYSRPKLGGATLGYQHDLRDDFDKAMGANTYYVSAWGSPVPELDLRASLGMRDEDMTEGSRLLGDLEHNRYRVSAKYKYQSIAWLKGGYENTHRECEQLGSVADFDRLTFDGWCSLDRYGSLSVGYAHAIGEYDNLDDQFEFTDDLLYGDLYGVEYRNVTPGFGATYYRSKRDLDVESFTLRFSLAYRFLRTRHVEAVYTVHNFDDYLAFDRYYTANIVEIRLTNDISF